METTLMEKETNETLSIINNLILNSDVLFLPIITALRNVEIHFIATIARGSSDHAATFAKYVFETQLEIATASIAPSIHTIYQKNINYKNSLVLGISQSGKSFDLVESMKYAKQNGAVTVSFINENNSPLADQSKFNIPLLAGKEYSVAATKSFIASLVRIIQLAYYLNPQNSINIDCFKVISQRLNEFANDKDEFPIETFKNAKNFLVLGRGYTFPIAMEAALKLKETSGIHAEAFSGAEVMHGPFELINKSFPVIVFLNKDETLPNMLLLIENFLKKEANIFIIGTNEILKENKTLFLNLPVISIGNSIHPIANSILFIHKFYKFSALFAKSLGRNPDTPKNLNKVTSTL
ncbi:SIS domain-containing protein [Pigmentibacter sp. JX0631]|uniref:SIS domain-containing protein n=1 Tax=Pigmentibacter sp. JX0631 TaxID=2976982 RepID=UPI002468EE2A|nr:SIS domain-containing protein [Pigmentibacter sp. JX0631]WGL59221.1 SIS domain-containing protein [Pigmentibacter sp. JX0631]